MDALENLLTRKSVRKFSEEKVSEEDINTILKAAMASPSAMNSQPWTFYIVTSKDKLQAYIDSSRWGKYNAQLIIVPCVKEDATLPGAGHDLAYCDLGAATENILLAAHALGLGAVWTAVYPDPVRIEAAKKAIDIKNGETPYSAIYIGHPAKDDDSQVKDKYNPNNIRRV